MKPSTRHKLKAIATASVFFFNGAAVGVSAFAIWAKRSGALSDDIRFSFVWMLLLLANLPALILQIADGISHLKERRQTGPNASGS